MNRLQTSSVVGGLLIGAWAAGVSPAWAATRLECQVTYAGTTETIIAQPTDNPYTVAATDIAGRFRFKPVLVAQANQLRYVSIYVYQQTRHQPTLIQQAKYLPPYPLPGPTGHIALTGEQRLYAGTMERELMYQCTLAEAKP